MDLFNKDCLFETKRLTIKDWTSIEEAAESEKMLLTSVIQILTPNVTTDLPDGWQDISNSDKAITWLSDRKNDSMFYAVQLLESDGLIGFLFLYMDSEPSDNLDLRLGYLLTESVWGKGFGSELIEGLVSWCQKENSIKSVSGGVDINNIGSIRILEKNGFRKVNEEMPENMLLYKREF